MKKSLFIVLILITSFYFNVCAQVFKAQIIAGTNISQVDGDEVYGYKRWGGNAGLGVIFPISKNKKWMISTELLYSQKGSQQSKTAVDTFETGWKYRLFLDYLEVPVMIHLEDKETWTFGLGLSWARMINVKEYMNGDRVQSTTITNNPYKRDDFNILVDVRFRIWQQLKFNFRYAYSLVPIRENVVYQKVDKIRNQYNNLLTFRLIYIINEKKEARKIKKVDNDE